ncbi:hypothetical protein AVR91_0204130 [Amycolatopsis keratiniphila subsp. keratiniphila]|uniref:GmrSD restriction endonucleases C-terminal domain-containing protein n=1 Tax=Amycolatopsis keratiniphila subsp. keratiniphila TaxID=227715 RepID=A0A1W2M2U1_9PSEU|nr:hypothetical protein AVR91_0204130 [Amycolatopsis keratiniphila subsp. keratiniphila]
MDRLPAGTPAAAEARTLLAQLREAAPGPMDGYERDCDKGKACVFGRPWIDTDGDGCDQRSQVLARDLDDVQRKPGRGRCKVTAGVLHDPYTSTEVPLAKVQIDHVVPLAAQWRAGAAAWPLERRIQAANDLGNLLAVQDKANARDKRDKTADQYMPPAFACGYSRIYTGVKARYGLAVTAAERAALTKGLATCPQ